MGEENKRGKQPEVPFGYEALLTDAQRTALDRYREQGWTLHFVRRAEFMHPTVVVVAPDTDKAWQITDDGELQPFDNLRRG